MKKAECEQLNWYIAQHVTSPLLVNSTIQHAHGEDNGILSDDDDDNENETDVGEDDDKTFVTSYVFRLYT